MDATITLGPGAINNGSSLLDGFFRTLYNADNLVINTTDQTADASTQPVFDGYDASVTFAGTFPSVDSGTIASFSIAYDGTEAWSVNGLDIDAAALKSAIEAAGTIDGGETVNNLFKGINWTMDASLATGPVLAAGTGGDDHFTLTNFNDILEYDGGNDVVNMGSGDDTLFFMSFSGLYADHGVLAINGGRGKDTLAFELAGNSLTGPDPIAAPTNGGARFNLVAGTVVANGVPDANTDHYSGFENVVGTDFADVIRGSDAANRLIGRGGEDLMIGLGGKDTLTGSDGSNTFKYLAASDSKTGKGRDVITDFLHGDDHIDLSSLHPATKNDKFHFIGENKLQHIGDLHFVLHNEKGSQHDYTLVEANLSGDARPELQIELRGLINTAGDFFL